MCNMSNTHRLHIRLPEKMFQALKKQYEITGDTVSSIVRRLIRKHLEENK